MSSIHSKLNLYAGGGISRAAGEPLQKTGHAEGEAGDAKPESLQQNSSVQNLRFGSLSLESVAPEVFCMKRTENHDSFGTVRLEQYRPFHLTGILQLALLQDFEAVHPEDLLFLDTETTGLSRGAGVLPFLTGLAYFQNGSPVVEQLFLDDFAGEESYLDRIVEKIASYPYLVTYNGKSFDIPLLRNRLILNRKRGVGVGIHFDLLHIFRRLAPRGSIAGHRQGDLEKFFLGHERTEDLPGSEVPQIYFDYKKYGESSGMERVFEHNRLDMLGMVYLFLEAVRIYEQKDVSRGSLRSGIARILNHNRRRSEAVEVLEELLRESLEERDEGIVAEDESAEESAGRASAQKMKRTPQADPKKIGGERAGLERQTERYSLSRLRYRDFLLLASLYRQDGRFSESAKVYAHIIEKYDCPFARLSLAKVAEHHLKDYALAVEQTAALLERHPEEPKLASIQGIVGRNDLLKRMERLLRKEERKGSRPPAFESNAKNRSKGEDGYES